MPLLLSGCGLLENVPVGNGHWAGYATQVATGRLIWTFTEKPTYRACIDTLHAQAKDGALHPYVKASEPHGCAYQGTSYWLVSFYGRRWHSDDFKCIAFDTGTKRYTPALKIAGVDDHQFYGCLD
jgi:hypothetical protein